MRDTATKINRMFNLHTKRDGNKIEGARKSNVNRKPIIMHRTFQSFRVLNLVILLLGKMLDFMIHLDTFQPCTQKWAKAT